MQAEELIKAAQVDQALAALMDAVRKDPASAKKRVFLFQLLCITGQWEKALTQLNVASELDASNLLMAQVCRPALQCEALRAEVFAGKRTPMVFGEPEPWVAWMIQAAAMTAVGKVEQAAALRAQALDAAPAVGGAWNGQPFDWIMDSDSRFGPILEAVIDGKYWWIPFHRIASFVCEEPTDLRDMVWLPGTFTWANGGESVGLIPVRYPGTEREADGRIRLSRLTRWEELGHDTYLGLGQRVFTTGEGDLSLLDVRELTFAAGEPSGGGG